MAIGRAFWGAYFLQVTAPGQQRKPGDFTVDAARGSRRDDNAQFRAKPVCNRDGPPKEIMADYSCNNIYLADVSWLVVARGIRRQRILNLHRAQPMTSEL